MESRNLEERLSRMATHWSLVFQAHRGGAGTAESARQQLVLRYMGAAYRYLLAAVRQPEVADELCQEFALRFLRGDFRRADPNRGRFRNYLKTALVHLVHDHQRRRHDSPEALPTGQLEPAAPAKTEDVRSFLSGWRAELLEQTWKALAISVPAYHTVLRARIEYPDLSSAQLAEQITAAGGKPITAVNVRKTLERAHRKFADLLFDEVATSLETKDPELVREELRQLDLLKYCGPRLAAGGGEAEPSGTEGQS